MLEYECHSESILPHITHFTFTESLGIRVNFLELHLGQIGHERKGFISAQLVWYQICLLSQVYFFH
jgi:hypothetical protein